MRVRVILLPIASYLICRGILSLVRYIDEHFMLHHPFIAAITAVILLTLIPAMIVVNIVYLLCHDDIGSYSSKSITDDHHRSLTWMEYQNYDNLNRIRQRMETLSVDSNRDKT